MATDLGLIISYKMGTVVDLLLFIHTFSFYSTTHRPVLLTQSSPAIMWWPMKHSIFPSLGEWKLFIYVNRHDWCMANGCRVAKAMVYPQVVYLTLFIVTRELNQS